MFGCLSVRVLSCCSVVVRNHNFFSSCSFFLCALCVSAVKVLFSVFRCLITHSLLTLRQAPVKSRVYDRVTPFFPPPWRTALSLIPLYLFPIFLCGLCVSVVKSFFTFSVFFSDFRCFIFHSVSCSSIGDPFPWGSLAGRLRSGWLAFFSFLPSAFCLLPSPLYPFFWCFSVLNCYQKTDRQILILVLHLIC